MDWKNKHPQIRRENLHDTETSAQEASSGYYLWNCVASERQRGWYLSSVSFYSNLFYSRLCLSTAGSSPLPVLPLSQSFAILVHTAPCCPTMSSLQQCFGLPTDLMPFICHSVLLTVHLLSFIRAMCPGWTHRLQLVISISHPASQYTYLKLMVSADCKAEKSINNLLTTLTKLKSVLQTDQLWLGACIRSTAYVDQLR